MQFILWASFATGQIGGKTSADGPFTLDNVEDVDTTASGVNRAWIAEYIYTNPSAFRAVSLTTSPLALAVDQTSAGALRYAMPTQPTGGYIDYSFGVPMPGVAGASSATYPGDISSFIQMTFLAHGSTTVKNQVNQVILECYASTTSPPYPQIFWEYPLPAGAGFERVTLTLRQPTFVLNAGQFTVEQLLGRTRYLSFYFYGGQETIPKTLTVHVDDIQLTGQAAAAVNDWSLY